MIEVFNNPQFKVEFAKSYIIDTSIEAMEENGELLYLPVDHLPSICDVFYIHETGAYDDYMIIGFHKFYKFMEEKLTTEEFQNLTKQPFFQAKVEKE